MSRTISDFGQPSRATTGYFFAYRLWLAVLGLILLAAMMPADSRAGGPITYAYDELGRLVAAVDTSITGPNVNATVYSYDAVGNLKTISNNQANAVAIFTFTPTNGPVTSTTVIIYGDGFSTTKTNNTVKFNGTTAAVSASTSATITTTVPAGATTGPIQVIVAGVGSYTSTASFKVTAN